MKDLSQDRSSTRTAREVLELGQALFDAIIEAATAPLTDDASASGHGPFPADDARAAADQFFTALQILLETRQAKDS